MFFFHQSEKLLWFADPLGVQGRKIQANGEDDCQQVWSGPLTGDRMVVALWNRCSKRATITATWDMIGLESTVSVSVRDLWQHKDVTDNASVSFETQVEAHDCHMYILTPQAVVSRSDV